MEKPFSLLEKAALLAMGLCVLLSVLSFEKTGDSVRNAVLRLHVIANSDSAADQALKLQVRDALLRESRLFAAADSKQKTAIRGGLAGTYRLSDAHLRQRDAARGRL